MLVVDQLSNPWQVQELSDFIYFCCPECNYRSKLEEHFEHHAVNRHPSSATFFCAEADPNGDLSPQNLLSIVKIESTGDIGQLEECSLERKEDEKHELANLESGEVPTNAFIEDKTHKCLKCDKTYSSLTGFRNHMKRSHPKGGKKHQCPNCEKAFTNSRSLRIHVESVHERMKVNCPLCDSVVLKHGLRAHMLVAHRGDRESKPYKCKLCDFSSHANRYLSAHIFNCHEKEKFPHECDTCGKKYRFPYLLREHKESEHDGIKRFMCHKCGKGFSKKFPFDEHVLKNACGDHSSNSNAEPINCEEYQVSEHDGIQRFICHKCGKGFLKKYHFDGHVQKNDCIAQSSISKKEPINCEECQEPFISRRNYILHFRAIHGGIPASLTGPSKTQFMCDQCPNVFLTKHNLKMHTHHVHSGMKPSLRYKKPKERKCAQCELTFNSLVSYREHIKVKHENDTPHKCDQCHRSYGTIQRLKSHKINMHRKVKCDECNQEIYNIFTLRRHKAAAHNIKPSGVFQCKHCPLVYSIESALEKHVKKQHPHDE